METELAIVANTMIGAAAQRQATGDHRFQRRCARGLGEKDIKPDVWSGAGKVLNAVAHPVAATGAGESDSNLIQQARKRRNCTRAC